MMGPKQEAQSALFYEFNLEQHVPQVRSIDRFVDLSGIRAHLAPFYSHTGRPSVDPELMIRMLLIGYSHGIRSERRLCEEVHLNPDPIPDHSTFSKNRHGRFRDSDLLRKVFEDVVAKCISMGAVGGERFATDASLIQADANKQNSTAKEEWSPQAIEPDEAPRAVRDYLEHLDHEAFGASTDVVPKFTSHSDPSSQWTAAHHGPAFFAYSTNYLIDTDHAIILDVEPSRSVRPAEVGATRAMIDRVKDRFDLWPVSLIADTAYGSGPMLNWLVEDRGIEPHIPVIDKTGRKDGTFEVKDFTFDREEDHYICPTGMMLKPYWRNLTKPRPEYGKDDHKRYFARKQDCGAPIKVRRCAPNGHGDRQDR